MSSVDSRIQDALTNLKIEREQLRKERDGGGNGGDTGGHEPPGGNTLEPRVAKLEAASTELRDKLVQTEARLGNIEANMATKVDIATLATKEDFANFVRATSKDMQDLAVAIQKQSADFHKTVADQTWKYLGVATTMAGLIAAIVFGLARILK